MFFGCSITASRQYEGSCGGAGVVFYNTELAILRALSSRTFGENIPSPRKLGAGNIAKGDNVKLICPFCLLYLETPGEYFEWGNDPLLLQCSQILRSRVILHSEVPRTTTTSTRNLADYLEVARGHLYVLLNFCKLYRTTETM